MIKTKIPTAAGAHKIARVLRFNADMYTTPPLKTMNDLLDEHRMKQRVKRAVMMDYAPQSLIDSIRKGIRA